MKTAQFADWHQAVTASDRTDCSHAVARSLCHQPREVLRPDAASGLPLPSVRSLRASTRTRTRTRKQKHVRRSAYQAWNFISGAG